MDNPNDFIALKSIRENIEKGDTTQALLIINKLKNMFKKKSEMIIYLDCLMAYVYLLKG